MKTEAPVRIHLPNGQVRVIDFEPNRLLRCVVSGSFKFKNQIDAVIEELEGYGVAVLDPPRGGIYKVGEGDFNPLKAEVEIPPALVEQTFLKNTTVSDFLYLVCPGGYFGNLESTGVSKAPFEVGFALGRGLPVFTSEPINLTLLEHEDTKELVKTIPIKTPLAAIQAVREMLSQPKATTPGLYIAKRLVPRFLTV